MPLRLIVGPANAGKVELLLGRYLDALEREPVLIVPNRSDVERVERDLLARRPGLLGGSIGTFDDVFERIAGGAPDARPLLSQAQRALLVRRSVAGVRLDRLSASARFGGFADALQHALGELESGLLDPSDLDGDLAALYAAYRAELDRLGLWDRDLLRRRAAERLQSDLSAWHGEPVFAYGFEDLTGAEWALLEALAARTEVTVSLPYEPGRPTFASLRRTADDLSRLAGGAIEELPPRYGEVAHPALAHLERALFSDERREPVPIDGAVRFFEGAGARGVLELVGEELLGLLRAGTAPERIGIVCPALERWRGPLDTVLGTLGIPYALDAELRLAQTPLGQALTALLRFAWLDGTRNDLFTFLRSPFSGLERRAVDFVEGRLRGRAVQTPERVVEETERLRGGPLPALVELREADDPVAAVRALAARMLRSAYGLDAPVADEASRLDLRAHEALSRLLGELERWRALAGDLSREDVAAAIERATLRPFRGDEPGRVAVVDLLRARTRRFDAVFVLGLEEGSLPRRGGSSPFLEDETRRALDERGARLERPDPVARDRYLFYTACTRPTQRLYLVREAATDEGSPREPSPFWEEVQAVFDPEDVRRWTRRRPLSALTWTLEAAPTERERLRALAELAARDRAAADALALANGWERRLERATAAFRRPTRITHPLVLEQLASKTTFNVTELERFADCSAAWFVDRFLEPRSIDAQVDAKLRGSVAHTALYKFFSRVPKELGVEKLEPRHAEAARRLMRACLDEALSGVRLDMTEMQAWELDQTLWRDLEAAVQEECESELPLVPRRFEVLFGGERAAPELQRGLDLGGGITLSGKIDRIDVDPLGARGIVQDYKSGKHAYSAREIESELRLQIPLYMLVLRDLVGLEPLGGLYRPLAGERRPRGLVRAAEAETLVGYARSDYYDEDAFWSVVENARLKAGELARRIREGDVRHDPKGGECPAWCDLWPMCRVERA
ncbi:MAG: PD-(D/E)XK nuclease family protein [Thermoleophilia bacterium]|nr:PD-(D/E)XK nuclease family protein [Thermoleophilia bacterium]